MVSKVAALLLLLVFVCFNEFIFFKKKKKNKLRAKEQFSTRKNNSQYCRYYQTGRYDPTAFAIQVREETDPVPNHGGACFMAG